MNRVNDFLSHMKERLSSPFIFSFVISWIFCNWKIVIALFWTDAISQDEHLNLIEYVELQANIMNSFIYPLALAAFYSFIWPVFNNIVSRVQAWYAAWGEEWTLRALKGGQVSVEKYFIFRDNYKKRTEALEKVLASESITLNELENTRTALLEQQRLTSETKHTLAETKAIVDNYNRVSVISGRWKRIWKQDGETFTESIEIQNNILYLHNDLAMEQKYNIFNFTYDINTKKIQFSLFHFQQGKAMYPFFSLNDLTLGYNELKGTEYRAKNSVVMRYVKDVAMDA